MRVSEIIELTGEFHATCFHCGSKVSRGGQWLGRGQEVVICRDSKCVLAALRLIYDAIYDVTEDTGATSEMLNELTKQVTRGTGGGGY